MYPDDPTDSFGEPHDESGPYQGQVRHHNVSALVPRDVVQGVFSNGVLIQL